jgi:hypothetical protein
MTDPQLREELDAVAAYIVSVIDKIPEVNVEISESDSPRTCPVVEVKTTIGYKTRWGERPYNIAVIAVRNDKITIHRGCSDWNEPLHIFSYADPQVFDKIYDPILSLVTHMYGSIVGGCTASIKGHEDEIEVHKEWLKKSKARKRQSKKTLQKLQGMRKKRRAKKKKNRKKK